MTSHYITTLALALLLAFSARHAHAGDSAAHVPPEAPRTLIPADRHEAFREYVTTGEGALAFARIRRDFDRHYLHMPFPEEPQTYGDPEPRRRTSDKADHWRAAQDTCGLVGGVAEAAVILWIGTGDKRYLDKAKSFLLASTDWSLDGSRWPDGPGPGGTAIFYNDEAHFRLWRKLPLVYDQIREHLSPEERARVLNHFRERGQQSIDFIKRARTDRLVYNSLEVRPASHPVRFMPMTGLTALALWDDLPEAQQWWDFAYHFYLEQFPPWGGDQGGWAEGTAYWRGIIEHASFQDALLLIGDPLAYNTPFWQNTGYFHLYLVQPYPTSTFGDLSNAGRFTLEPATAEFLTHLARVLDDGYLLTYARLIQDQRPSPSQAGLGQLDRIYPNATEFLLRNFNASHLPLPQPHPLCELPPYRYFEDIGWVTMHSALGQPTEDIHISFKSSPYGSFSHSHADQNAFVLSAYGENLAIASGYREWHNSPHHNGWTRLTKSKNAILIDGIGQKPQEITATGRISHFETGPRHLWTTGDATAAYAVNQQPGQIRAVLRDLIFIDQRYLIIRDYIETATPARISWLLHTEQDILWDDETHLAYNETPGASLTTLILTPDHNPWQADIRTGFDVPVDPAYVDGHPFFGNKPWDKQFHMTLTTPEPDTTHDIWAILWPQPDTQGPAPLTAYLDQDTLVIHRPDGITDHITLRPGQLTLTSSHPNEQANTRF